MIGWILAGVVAVPTLSGYLFLHQEKFGALPEGKRLERILRSPHQKGGVFQNLEATPTMTSNRGQVGSLVDFLFTKHPRTVPKDSIPSVKSDLKSLGKERDLVVWFGHSSYLLQLGGTRILVDPVFSGHSSPFPFGFGAFPGSDRYRVPDMPPIDVLVITHDHWDHLDWATVKALRSQVGKVVCGLGVGAHLERWGFDTSKIAELDWGDSLELPGGIELTALPARHFSGRGLHPNRSLWCSYALRSAGRRVFLGGDGGYGTHLAAIGREHGPFDLAILEQGQYDSAWRYIHMLPPQLAPAMRDLRAARLMPVHNSKFSISNHPWNDPLEHLEASAREGGFSLLTPRIGEVAFLDDTAAKASWWKGLR